MLNGLLSVIQPVWLLDTCSYRLLPEIQIKSPITGADAYLFQKCFLPNVIAIENVDGVETARVANPRLDSVSRECLRHDQFKDKVKLMRVRDHFICNYLWIFTIVSIESTGAYKAVEIFEEACLILESKCDGLLNALKELS